MPLRPSVRVIDVYEVLWHPQMESIPFSLREKDLLM